MTHSAGHDPKILPGSVCPSHVCIVQLFLWLRTPTGRTVPPHPTCFNHSPFYFPHPRWVYELASLCLCTFCVTVISSCSERREVSGRSRILISTPRPSFFLKPTRASLHIGGCPGGAEWARQRMEEEWHGGGRMGVSGGGGGLMALHNQSGAWF